MPLLAQSFAEPEHCSLVVLLHAYRHTPDRLKWVRQAVREFMPDAHVVAPELPLRMSSTADLNQVAADVVTLIDQQVDYCAAQHGRVFDTIVACFPGALERLSWQDLGSAGHNGFVQAQHPSSDLQMLEIRFVEGGHGAALSERQWDDIARFICKGEAPNAENRATTQTRSARFLGDYPWIVWGVIVAVLAGATSAIWQIPAAGVRTLALVAFAWVVVKILTRF